MSRRSTVLPKSAERRSTPTTVRASGFERSGDNSTAYAKARPRVSVQAEGKDEGDPTLARPVRRSALSRSDPRRCREGCNPHPAVPSPRSSAKSHKTRRAIRPKGKFRVAIGPRGWENTEEVRATPQIRGLSPRRGRKIAEILALHGHTESLAEFSHSFGRWRAASFRTSVGGLSPRRPAKPEQCGASSVSGPDVRSSSRQ